MDAAAERDFNSAARALLETAISQPQRPTGGIRLGIAATAGSFAGDPQASSALLRRLLTSEEVREHGFHQLQVLAEEIDKLLAQDLDLVLDIYRATFSWRDTSDDATPMRGGVLALTSNRRQDYDGARRDLAEHFPALIEHSPDGAISVLTAAVAGYLAAQDQTPEAPQELWLAGEELEVYADHSAYWDRADRPRDPEVDMLVAWQSALEATAGDNNARAAVMTGLAATSPIPACLLSRLLTAAAKAPEHATLVFDALPNAAVLAQSDTVVAYGEALKAMWPTLGEEIRRNIEESIMALPDTFRPDVPAAGENRRDRLVGLLPRLLLVSEEAQQLFEDLDRASEISDNPPLVGVSEFGFRAIDDDEVLRRRGVEPDLTDNRRALDLAHALRDWHNARTQSDVETQPLERLIEALEALIAALPQLRESSELAGELLAEAEGYLAQGGLDLAKHITPDSPAEHLDLSLQIARDAAGHALPDAQIEDPEKWDGELAGWSWPAPRVEAASIYLILGRHPELASAEVLDGIGAAAIDPSAAVRIKVAEYGWWVQRADLERVWSWAKTAAEQEERAGVVRALLVTISHLYPHDRNRAVTLVEAILTRERDCRASGHLLAAIAGLMGEWWIYEDRPEGRALLDEILAQLPEHLGEASEVTHRLRRAVCYSEGEAQRAAEIRVRAFEIYAQLVMAACDRFDELVAQSEPDGAQLRAISELLDTLAAELYFSSGAYSRQEADDQQPPPDPEQFYSEAATVLDAAVRISVPRAADYLLRTLSNFVDVDPRGVIRRIDELLSAGERWGLSADSLVEGHFMPTVSHLLAAHRDLLMSDTATRGHLVSALSTFSRAGLPSARRILYGLDDMFR